MKVLKVDKSIMFYVTPDFDEHYRRGGIDEKWEQYIGGLWEPLFDDTEIESAFQEYMLSKTL